MSELKTLKRLDEIREEVGKPLFTKFVSKAQISLETSPYLYRGADARHTFLYDEIIHQYRAYKEQERTELEASKHASDNPLMWWDMTE